MTKCITIASKYCQGCSNTSTKLYAVTTNDTTDIILCHHRQPFHRLGHAKVTDRESNRIWTGGSRKKKEHEKLMNRDEGSYQVSHIYDNWFAVATPSSNENRSQKGSSNRQNFNNNKDCIQMNLYNILVT